ncbi:MAG: Cache domain protein [Methylococcales bacterium]|nr:Cache domain protein [Methylococcales bacterium]
MSKMSHINVIEKYEEHRLAIHHLLASILRFFADRKMFEQSQEELVAQFNSLYDYYPFISLFYLLDADGKQVTACIKGKHVKSHAEMGVGADRSNRPYYLAALNSDNVVITEPYLASVRRELCLSASVKMLNDDDSVKGYVVLNIDLNETLSFLTGDSRRILFEPYFKAMYSFIVLGLFSVAGVLMYTAALECIKVALSLFSAHQDIEIPFGVVIYLTLALAIFDLGKTTLEEEVLLYKDILRHSSTRRTITRFIAVIIIAVSIEALLMIFKAALHGGGEQLIEAVWIIIATALLLVSLGVYVYLGSRAEAILLKNNDSMKIKRDLTE